MITTNELPVIRDASGTIASRFVPLKLEQTFLGREDLELKNKILPELAGILNWALDGLDRLRRRGHFNIPTSSRESIRELEDLASPVGAFVRDWCEIDAGNSVNVKELYQGHRRWAEENGYRALQNHVFGRSLRAVVPAIRYSGAGAARRYVGVALSEQGQSEFDELLKEKGMR